MTTQLAIVGAGKMASGYVYKWLKGGEVSIVAIVDTDSDASAELADGVATMNGKRPVIFSSLDEMEREGTSGIDAAYIATPHALHATQAGVFLMAGVDVLLEKPMVTTVADARRLVNIVEKTDTTLVIAYQGALSNLVRQTQIEVQNSTYGALFSVSGCIWEDWKDRYHTSWKQAPMLSGGGFLLDTGAHLINTMTMIVGSAVQSVSAYQNSLGTDVDIVSVVAGEFGNGVLFCVNGSGHTQLGQCKSEISLFFERAIVRIDAWGRWKKVETTDHINPETFDISEQLIDIFCRIRNGDMPNPSDVYQGLRFSLLWDGITESINSGGRQARIQDF
jgi:predicted dehydrogenase